MHSLDIAVQKYLSMSRTPGMTEFWFVFTTFFNLSLHIAVVIACVAVLVWMFRGRKYAVLFVSAIVGGSILGYILKVLFAVSRPLDPVIAETSKSFPSGHALTATIFFGMLMFIFDKYFSRKGRIAFNAVCVLMILAVSFSRLYLGEHWLSDVLGGMALGTLTCYISILVFRKLYPRA
jgi:membrane-associated phospholipid phosphatase